MDWLCLFAQALMRNFLSSFREELEERLAFRGIVLCKAVIRRSRECIKFCSNLPVL